MTRLFNITMCAAVCGATLAAAAGTAAAAQINFVGVHPIAAAHGDGFCYIEVPHIHVYDPDHSDTMYRQVDDHHHFVGDPVAYDYDGPTYTYYGHHPIAVDVVVGEPRDVHYVEHCYLDGPHYHYYEPPADWSFQVEGGAFWYVGAYAPEYERDRARRVKINEIYARISYERPIVTVSAPAAYLGPIVEVRTERVPAHKSVHGDAHPVRGSAGVEVHGGVEVYVPVPSLEVSIGIGGVAVGGQHHHGGEHKPKKHKNGKHKYKRNKH